ncbi:hypothetical protein [Halovivax sp.]|uniref:hypothetical protein n=1 Tax=Halovivax sp. TaxID=1935978 RepID=UPI0025BF6445|nr:hypothetical protein [Halovivax sp.]
MKESRTNRRGARRGVGAGALGLTAGATTSAAGAEATDATDDHGRKLTLELELGHDRVLEGWEELDDYHDVRKDVLASIDVRGTIAGGEETTLFCQTAAMKRSTVRTTEVTNVHYPEDPREEVHTHRTAMLDGEHEIFGVVVDAFEDRTARDRIEFTVR